MLLVHFPNWFWVLIVFVAYPFRILFDGVFETWTQELEFALIDWGLLSSYFFHGLEGRVSNRDGKNTFELALQAAVTNRLRIGNTLRVDKILVDGRPAEQSGDIGDRGDFGPRQLRTYSISTRNSIPWPGGGIGTVNVTAVLADRWNRTQERNVTIQLPG